MPTKSEQNPTFPNEAQSYFPWRDTDEEIQKISEALEGIEASIVPTGDMGYMILKSDWDTTVPATPCIIFDYDDTIVQTSHHTADNLLPGMIEPGISSQSAKTIMKLSTVDFGSAGKRYQPELAMRLASKALSLSGANAAIQIQNQDEYIETELSKLRDEMVKYGSLGQFPIDDRFAELFDPIQNPLPFYPGMDGIFERLLARTEALGKPTRQAIMTYGDPLLQARKVRSVLTQSPIGAVFLTKVNKGNFFRELVRGNYLNSVNEETPFIIVDDSPTQLESIAGEVTDDGRLKELGNPVRLVRARFFGAKKSERPAKLPRGSVIAEIANESAGAELLEEAVLGLLEDLVLANISQRDQLN